VVIAWSGTWFALAAGAMSTGRHRAIVDSSEGFARGARRAEAEKNHALAAVLYWAATMVLEGHSLAQIEVTLQQFIASQSSLFPHDPASQRGGLHH
jgi:hypothetical protein